jgi:LEA14-like dessication related protein
MVLREPVVSLRSVEISGLSLEGLELVCFLDLGNPNAGALPFPEIAWELFINASSFRSGTVPGREAIGPGSTQTLRIPLSLSYAGLMNAFKSLKGRNEVDYRITLETRFLLPVLGERLWNLEYRGKLPLVRMISFRDPSFTIERLDFSGADILCSLKVDNPNPFPVPFPAINYQYAVRNSNFAAGTVESAALAAAALTAVDIRLRVASSDLYQSIPALRNAGEAACLFALSSLVSLPGFGEERLSLDVPGNLPLLVEPVMSFKGISVKNIALSRINLEFDLELDNPNRFDFRIENLDYEFLINSRSWAQGGFAPGMEIAAGRKAAIPVTVAIDSPSMVKDVTDSITKGMDVAYEIKGIAALSSRRAGFANSPVPFSLSGRTRLRR